MDAPLFYKEGNTEREKGAGEEKEGEREGGRRRNHIICNKVDVCLCVCVCVGGVGIKITHNKTQPQHKIQ